MTNVESRSMGSTVFTWAMIAGAALLLMEVTLSSLQPAASHAPTVQTMTVAGHTDRLARN
jgi:hypothetical protein